MSIDLRDRLREKYGVPAPTPVDTGTDAPVHLERAFVVHAESGRTLITAPIRELAMVNPGFMYLHGRFVQADTPNANGALWSTEDLQMGEPTVAGGPLNWLHDEHQIIGSLLQAELVADDREAARNFSTDKRKKMSKAGTAMPDGSFPIANAEDLANAIRLAGKAKDPAKARAHIKKRARALGLYDRIPDSWKSEKSELEIGNHIAATAAVWRFLFPAQAHFIEKASADGQLYFSMECVAREVACIDSPGREGCGEHFSYADYDAGRACAHLNERTSIRRLVDPVFLGGAVIVPPVKPGWSGAEAHVVRQAAALSEKAHLTGGDLTRAQAENLAAAVLEWANRP